MKTWIGAAALAVAVTFGSAAAITSASAQAGGISAQKISEPASAATEFSSQHRRHGYRGHRGHYGHRHHYRPRYYAPRYYAPRPYYGGYRPYGYRPYGYGGGYGFGPSISFGFGRF